MTSRRYTKPSCEGRHWWKTFPQLSELDLNPVIVKRPSEGLSIVDARIRIRPIEQAWLPSRKDIPGAHRRRPFNMTGSH